MSWTDYKSIEQIKKLKDYYDIHVFVETGTFRGINAEVHSQNFERVITCELLDEYYEISRKRLDKYWWVQCEHRDSPEFLKEILQMFNWDFIFIYLDAHFYDPNLKPEDRWVVLKELKALQNSVNHDNFIIAIHDFDNGELGHLTYDGQPLNFDLLKDDLYKINPYFNFYTNTKEGCDIITLDKMKIYYPHVELDDNIADTINFVWSSEQKAYRGILYCTPTQLDLTNFELRKL